MKSHPALTAYQEVIAQRDLAGLMKLVAPEVTLLLPQGQLLAGAAEFETFHREWFADPDWAMGTDLVRSQTDDHTAVFVLNVVYLDKDRSGQPVSYPYFLGLTFRKTSGRWLLVLDQNTPIHT